MKSPDCATRKGLRWIRTKRRLCLLIIFAFLPFCAVLAGLNNPLILLLGVGALFALGFIVQRSLNRSRCPRCGEFFFTQVLTRENWTPFSSLSFPPERKCRHCRLDLYE
ncbi:MAG: hypothetical protein RDV41_12550 [Planctomycetota bacterium]|nr:hypothetical protein [Planctomycetota bacterium]